MTSLAMLEPDAALSDQKSSEALMQIVESSVEVRRRYQFFVWTQAKVAAVIPHEIAVCGLYQRTSKELAFEAFNSVPVVPSLLSLLTDARSSFMQQLVGSWLSHSQAMVLDLSRLGGDSAGAERERLSRAGIVEMLVHGVSRPQRPAELESMFIFISTKAKIKPAAQTWLDMLLPHIHSTYLRAQDTERSLAGNRAPAQPAAVRRGSPQTVITEREKQILGWVREGNSNLQIGVLLGISPLTVKNHLQKILRKLDAVNRAQAVAKAMSMGILERSSGFAPLDGSESGLL